jgi:membrane protein YdbS with pleckstrin-like domain
MAVLTILLSGRFTLLGTLLVVLAWAAFIATAGALAWFVPALRFRHTRYRLDDHGLLIHRGRLFHSELAVLRSRIQHTDVSQGPLQRLFGLGTLVVHTAGSAHAAIPLGGISFSEARRLRAELTGGGTDDVV